MLDNLILFPTAKKSSYFFGSPQKMSQALTVHETESEYETAFDTEYDPNYPTVADVMARTEASPFRTTGRVRYTQAEQEEEAAEAFCCQFPQKNYVKANLDLRYAGLKCDEIMVLQFLIERYKFAKTYHKLGRQKEFLLSNNRIEVRFNFSYWERDRVIKRLKAQDLITTFRRKQHGLVHYRINFKIYRKLCQDMEATYQKKSPLIEDE